MNKERKGMQLVKQKRCNVFFMCALLVMMAVFVGYQSAESATSERFGPSSPNENVSQQSEVVEQTQSPQSSQTPQTRFVLDSDGNKLEIPYYVTKAAPTAGAMSQMTQMLSQGEGKMSAAPIEYIYDYFKELFPDYLISNANNYDVASVEDLIASGTQVTYGPGNFFSEDQKQQLKSAGIVFVPINNLRTTKGICQAVSIIGNILGDKSPQRANEFISYYLSNMQNASTRIASIAPENRLRVAKIRMMGDKYTTVNGRDIFTEYLDSAGGINVAEGYNLQTASSWVEVDVEQVIQWNPQIIVTGDQQVKKSVLNDPALVVTDAVKNGKVYVIPCGLYLWSVRSGEGAMLPLWLGTILYPSEFSDIDMKKVVRDFFNEFYGYDISEKEIENVLAGGDVVPI